MAARLPSCTGAGGTGTRYTYAQLMALWVNAGGSSATAPIAAAIAMAESGGCSAAVNDTDNGGTQTSWGLWQLSDGSHSQPVPNVLTPTVNASAAVEKWRNHGESFSDWGSYTSGAYRKYLSTGTTPDFGAVPATTAGAITAAADATRAAAAGGDTCAIGIPPIALSFAPDFPGVCLLSKSQFRSVLSVGTIIVGGVVFVTGLALLIASSRGRAGKATSGVLKAAVT